jgi:ABC-2 type transport system permease protein
MNRLLDVEARRYLSRRLVRFLVGLAVLGMLIAGTVLFFKSHRVGPEEARALQQQAEAQRAHDIQRCAAGEFGIPPSEVPPGETLEQFCRDQVVGPVQVVDPRFHLTALRDVFLGTNGILVAVFLLLGASFVGAEWHAGTMTTLLTWEPRRVRVIVAKVAVAAALAFIGYVVLQALLGLALTPAAVVRGSTAGADAAWLREVAGFVLRGGVAAAIAATLGASLAAIGRNTAAALGVLFGYIAILEPLLRGLRPKWTPWLLFSNLSTFLLGNNGSNAEFSPRSTIAAGILVGTYALGVAAIAAAMFKTRDVT